MYLGYSLIHRYGDEEDGERKEDVEVGPGKKKVFDARSSHKSRVSMLLWRNC